MSEADSPCWLAQYDSEYVIRLAAINSKGQGDWSKEVHAETLPLSARPRALDLNIPPTWLELRYNIQVAL